MSQCNTPAADVSVSEFISDIDDSGIFTSDAFELLDSLSNTHMTFGYHNSLVFKGMRTYHEDRVSLAHQQTDPLGYSARWPTGFWSGFWPDFGSTSVSFSIQNRHQTQLLGRQIADL